MKSVDKVRNTIIFPLVFITTFPFAVLADETSDFEQIDPSYYETDVPSLINVETAGDIINKRRALIRYIWQDKGFPYNRLPSEVEENIKDERYAELFKASLRQIDKLTVNMDYGLNSIVYHFIPNKANSTLIIYHQGHRGDFIKGMNTIRAFLEQGYSVMGFSMPLLGMNNRPAVDLERFGRFQLENHEHLKFFKSPIKFFVEPIAVALNYAAKFKYSQVHMIGISGGGWTTILYAAIDTRIQHSYPVAGSLPIYLRSSSRRDWGEFEQTLPDLYNTANYLELYIMGSVGRGRKQLQVLNKYDSCCFAGIKYRTYEEAVKNVVNSLGNGEFQVFLDETHKEHQISDGALKVIFKNEGVSFVAAYSSPGKDSTAKHENRIRLEHVAINVKDPAKMAQWYCDNLGMKIVRKGPSPVNMRFISDAGGNMMLEIYNSPLAAVPDYASKDPRELHIAFMVDDVKRVHEKLIAAGATPVQEVEVTPSGDEITVLRDPWGVPIQFVKRANPMLLHN